MTEFVVLCIPALVYLLVRRRQPAEARQTMGLQAGAPTDWALALVVVAATFAGGWLATRGIPAEVRMGPGTTGRIAGLGAAGAVILRAVGEEVFFRGFLGGLLMKRLGFWWGNTVQALLFLAPHLLLLTVSPAFWPLMPVQFLSGWLMGWLRHRHDSIGPPSLAHALVNLATGLTA